MQLEKVLQKKCFSKPQGHSPRGATVRVFCFWAYHHAVLVSIELVDVRLRVFLGKSEVLLFILLMIGFPNRSLLRLGRRVSRALVPRVHHEKALHLELGVFGVGRIQGHFRWFVGLPSVEVMFIDPLALLVLVMRLQQGRDKQRIHCHDTAP